MITPVAFLSHSSENSLVATRLATDLRSQGVDVWFDEWEIRPGDSLRRKIDEGIENASFFLVLLTPESVKSEWVQIELDAGMVKRIQGQCRLIPILLKIRDEQVPTTLRGISWVRLDNYQDGFRRLVEVCHGLETKPPLGPKPQRDASVLSEMSEIVLPSVVPAANTYAQWAGHMQLANRDGQLVSVVANFGHVAERFDSEEKFIFPQVLPKYLDVQGFGRPFVDEAYVQFEFNPTQDGRRIWLQAVRGGVLAIEVWRSWYRVPWDWLLAEAYSSLLCLRDERLMTLFQSSGIVEATLTLGNLLGLGGATPDVEVTTRGLRLNLIPPGEEFLGQRPRVSSVQYECEATVNTDPWGCAKAFIKRILARTGVLRFEKRLDEIDKDEFLGVYFDIPSEFHRPGIPLTF